MAGIYLHIPFCKTRCVYCDFYSTTRDDLRRAYIRALCRELEARAAYLQGEPVRTLYLGGGTPSQLAEADFCDLFNTIEQVYGVGQLEEITLEANPDDLTPAYVDMLRSFPFNRISMGIQTFHDPTLRLLHRRHSATQAIEAVARCREAGFQNISIDLIYGLPGETHAHWMADLEQAIALQVEHISAYHLIYEEGTPLYHMLQTHQVDEVDEESSVDFFATLIDTLTAAGYEHYEISNFCKPGLHSRHNSSYWHGIPYLGCGPSAHSFNGSSRQWNVASLTSYIDGMEQGVPRFEIEQLDLATRYNEYIMTSLRTSQGISLTRLADTFGSELAEYCRRMAAPYVSQGLLQETGVPDTHLRLTRQGIFISDGIISDLMRVND